LLTVSQTALVTKTMGLAMAAIWATAPKLFQLIFQLISKLWDYRVPHLSVLMAESKIDAIIPAFRNLFKASAFLGGGALGATCALNTDFLRIWTRDEITWNPVNNILVALVIYSALLIKCITDFVLHTKKVGWMPALMLLEGLLFVVAALWLLPQWGISGMLAASLVAGGTLRLPYAWKRFRSFLELDGREVVGIVVDAFGGLLFGIVIYFILMGAQGLMVDLDPWIAISSQAAFVIAILALLAAKFMLLDRESPQRT
jgi:hypothetical protein